MSNWRYLGVSFFCLALALAAPGAALAHTGDGATTGFASGFAHPFRGADHLLAMFAVGIWGAQIGGRSLWTLPVVFPMIMALGGILGIARVPMVAVEPAIGLSVLVLGLVIAVAWKAPEWLAVAVVGGFAVFHGYAHGVELPKAVDPTAYGAGFIIATGFIHIAGIGFGLFFNRPLNGWIARGGGGLIALAGIYFLWR